MTRSSRYKEHKQEKYSYKDDDDDRGESDSEEDRLLKNRNNGGNEVLVRVSRDSVSGEKRKLASALAEECDDMYEDYVVSKRRKEKGVEEERGKRVTRWEGSQNDSEKALKLKLVDSNIKYDKRYENLTEVKEENARFSRESGEGKRSGSSKGDLKHKSEKDLHWKEVPQFINDTKDKEHGREKDRKRGSQSGYPEDERRVKQEVKNSEWDHELRNPDLEKELENRMKRRRDGSAENDKYQEDKRNGNYRGLSPRDDRAKSGKDRDERSDRDKYKDDRYRDKYREYINRDYRHQDDKRRDDRSSRDHMSDRSDTKHSRDDSKTAEYRHSKSKPQDSDRDRTPHRDEQGDRYKDNKGKKGSPKDNEGYNYLKSPSTTEYRSDVEKKTLSSTKSLSLADRGRSQPRYIDVDTTVSSSKWKASPSSSAHISKDEYRNNSTQAETKYRDSMPREKTRSNIVSSRDLTGVSGSHEKDLESRPMEKHTQKDDKYLLDVSNERSRRSDAQAPSKQFIEKSPSSSSFEHRYSNKPSVRRNLDVEETAGRSSGSKDARYFSANEDRRSRDLPSEKPSADGCFQSEGDTLSISSSIKKTSHLPSNSSSLLPAPSPRSGIVSPSVLGSSEEDGRGKPSNRYRRYADSNVGRGIGNAWKGVPNWPSPVTNGFISYPHGQPPGGLHPLIQPFPTHMFGVRPSMELNHSGMPYHISDADRFSGHGRSFGWQNPADGIYPPHLHGWDGSNGVFGDGSQIYGIPSWDQNRQLMSGRGWEMSTEMWKGQNGGGMTMELPTAAQKDPHLQHVPAKEPCLGQPGGSRNDCEQPGSNAECLEVKPLSSRPLSKKSIVTEASAKAIHDHKKIPQPSEISHHDNARFCHVYLSKLDISADLTHPKLYNHCLSVIGEGNTASHTDVAKLLNLEDCTEAGVKISSDPSSASFFPKINDSLFQKAMALYKKQAEESFVKPYISSLPKSIPETLPTVLGDKQEPVKAAAIQKVQIQGPASGSEKLEPVLASENEKVEEPIPTLDLSRAEQPIPTSAMKEPIPTLNQEKAEEPIPSSELENVDEPISISHQEKTGEPIPTSEHENAEERIPTPDQEKVEVAVLASYQEKAEEPTLTFDQETAKEAVPASCQEEAISTSNHVKVEDTASTLEQNVEGAASTHDQNVEGASSIHDQHKEEPIIVPVGAKQEHPDPTSMQENVESATTLEKLDGSLDSSSFHENTSLATTDSLLTEDANMAVDCKSDHPPSSSKEHSEAFDAMSGIVGLSEGCEALMPESIECGSVNLSRIHQFPENTH